MNKRKLSAVAIIIIIISVFILGFITVDRGGFVEENSYTLNYDSSNENILIYQDSGDKYSGLEVSIYYTDDYVRNESVRMHGESDNHYITSIDRSDYAIESVELYIYTDGEKQILDTLGSTSEEIDIDVPDKELESNILNINIYDYIDNSENIESVEWEIDNSRINAESVNKEFSQQGNYDATVYVTDKYNNTYSDTFIITVPLTNFESSGSPYLNLELNEEFILSANNLFEDTDEEHSWDFDDGEKATGQTINHSYSEVGEYTVTVTSDNDIQTIPIIVSSDVNPNFDIIHDSNLTFTFNASSTEYIDTDKEDVQYNWNLADGTIIEDGDEKITHTYSESNVYNVELTIISDVGREYTTEKSVYPRINVTFADTTPYIITDITDGFEDVVLPDNEIGDEWPEISFTSNSRYQMFNIPSDIEFVDENGNVLLSQKSEGSFENDNEVNWVDNGDSVKFTVTDELGTELYGYRTDS